MSEPGIEAWRSIIVHADGASYICAAIIRTVFPFSGTIHSRGRLVVADTFVGALRKTLNDDYLKATD